MDDNTTTITTSVPLRVLVVARQPVARAGLRGLLSEVAGVAVVSHAATIDEATEISADLRPDVVMAGWEGGDTEEMVALVETLGALGIPLVLLGSAPSASELSALLRAGSRGFLLPDATAAEVGVAIEAAARGLLVLDPLLGRALPTAMPVALTGEAALAEPLTDRERDVLQLMALGLPNKAIARQLGITEHTVKFHVGSILAKLGASSRTEAVTRAARQGTLAL